MTLHGMVPTFILNNDPMRYEMELNGMGKKDYEDIGLINDNVIKKNKVKILDKLTFGCLQK